MKVLCIEDNRADAFLLEEMLRINYGEKMRLRWEGSLREGLLRLLESKFDMIFLDLGLGESHGLDTFKSVAAIAKGTPILVVSGLDDQDIATKAVELGAEGYFVKGGFTESILKSKVEAILEKMNNQKYQAKHEDAEYIDYIRLLKAAGNNAQMSGHRIEMETQLKHVYEEYKTLNEHQDISLRNEFYHLSAQLIDEMLEKNISTQDLILLHETTITSDDGHEFMTSAKKSEFLQIILLMMLERYKQAAASPVHSDISER